MQKMQNNTQQKQTIEQLIESINTTKNIVLYSKYILLTHA